MSDWSTEFRRPGDEFINVPWPGRWESAQRDRHHSADLAIDAALRSVAIPDGLIPRLQNMFAAMGDEPASRTGSPA